jgi:hypothetical protein
MPLVPMEQFMLWDDSPAYPKRFRVVNELRGEVDVAKLDEAIAKILPRHPLLLAQIDLSTPCPTWVLPERPHLRWVWGHEDWQVCPDEFLRDKPGTGNLRIWGGGRDGRAHLTFEVHHAACDGLGLRQLVGDLFRYYDYLHHAPSSAGRPSPSLIRLEPERLRGRGIFQRPAPDENSRPTSLWEKLTQAYDFHCRGPVPLFRSSRPSLATPPPLAHHYLREQLDPAATQQLISVWNKYGDASSTLNDRAIARLLEVMAEWNERSGRTHPKQRLRVMMPVDLRSHADGRLPAANRLGFGFVISDLASCRNPEGLGNSVSAQTRAIRRLSLGLDFLEIFGLLAASPRLARWIVQQPRCMASAVLTNLGDVSRRHRRALLDQSRPLRIGNLELESVVGFPPLRPKTHLGLGLCRSPRGLTVGLIADASHFSMEECQDLLKRFLNA